MCYITLGVGEDPRLLNARCLKRAQLLYRVYLVSKISNQIMYRQYLILRSGPSRDWGV